MGDTLNGVIMDLVQQAVGQEFKLVTGCATILLQLMEEETVKVPRRRKKAVDKALAQVRKLTCNFIRSKNYFIFLN